MKNLIVIISLLILFLGSSNCFSQQDQSDTEFEQAVFYEIFSTIFDSIHSDRRLIPPPPPSPEYLKKRGYDVDNKVNPYTKAYEDWKKSDDYKNQKRKWEKKKDSIERDTAAIYLTIPDSIGGTEENDISELIKHFGHHNISIDSFTVSNAFKINLSKLETNHKKVKFIFQTHISEDGDFWRTDYGKYIAASIFFTKIIFDKTKSYGVLNAGYVMAPLNGYGVRIFIKKNDDGKWVVDEVKGTYIS